MKAQPKDTHEVKLSEECTHKINIMMKKLPSKY